MRMDLLLRNRPWLAILLAGIAALLLAGCGATRPAAPPSTPAGACPLTEPVQFTPPDDEAIYGSPSPGYFYANDDRSIFAAAPSQQYPWRAGHEGNKVGWFRPAGATLEISGQRLDAAAAPLQADVPCCYPTRFQATGLAFPAAGCWRVTARAGDRSLSFVVQVQP